jgi:hypothetical protein
MKLTTAYTTFTTLSLLYALLIFVTLLLFLRSFNLAPWIYIWGLSSAITALSLLIAVFSFRSHSKIPVAIGAVGSTTFLLTSTTMLVRISIAQGYDSQEIFWFLILPMILTFSQASAACLKLKNRLPR